MWYVNIYKVEDTDDGLHVVRHFIRHVKSFKNKKLAVDLSVEVDQHLSLAGDVVSGEYRGGHTAAVCQDDVGRRKKGRLMRPISGSAAPILYIFDKRCSRRLAVLSPPSNFGYRTQKRSSR
jgi:hypothetical protein